MSEPMLTLPKGSENSLLLRTDFSDETAWTDLCDQLREPSDEGFLPRLDIVSDRAYEGLTVQELVALNPRDAGHPYAFLADQVTLVDPERPILVIDFFTEPGRTFRVVPAQTWSVENNLSLANMDFCEFAESVDADGVFRGFH